ncbi:hypothetical protein [Mucilaginibacter sp. KACC 22063]|uniref:hypothetical protein n=1 Tax=Mucilaginibacter sp. KACC 22063 TaxID=3025666 RepID=UPI002366CFF6|nr:hypothetical protein [Mucilaginibacter sp. KACC 22063]WDF57260.1 hypothetical protein PQ461_09365 [Mucilaginibacter sp. KACC 22063]
MADITYSPVWPGPCVLIPMTTDILLIGQIDYNSASTWSSVKYNYSNLYLQQTPDQPAPFYTKHCPEVGAHVMWTLPYSMRQGAQQENTTDVQFPTVPNRWLITRFQYPRNINADITSGPVLPGTPVIGNDGVNVLVSDEFYDITSNPDNYNQYPYPEDQDFPVRGIGQTYALVDFKGEASAGTPFLQAVGPGDVSWSVAYDNVTNVFSLHDNLGEDAAIYTYSIFGWYDTPANDLLADMPVDSPENWLATLREKYRWTIGNGIADLDAAIAAWQAWQQAHGLQGAFDPDKIDLPEQEKAAIIAWHNWLVANGDNITPSDLPTQTICHSMIGTVTWEGTNYAYGSGAPGGGTAYPDLAMGMNAIEAISTYMANKIAVQFHQEPFVFDIERGFEAFQRDLIFDLQDNPVMVETLLHNARFETGYAGQEWIVVLAEQAAGNTAGNGGQQTIPLDPTDTQKLIDLNTLQDEVNTLFKLIASQRTELFSLSIKDSYIGRSTPADIVTRVKQSISAISDNLKANLTAYDNKNKQAIDDAEALQASLGAEYVVKAVDLVAFAAPNDPVVMVAGINQDTKLNDPTQFGEGNFLQVRMTGETISSITVSYNVGGTIQAQTIGAEQILSAVTLPAWNAIPKEVMDLWLETMLLDISFARQIATLFLNMCGVSNPTNPQINPIAQQVRAQQTSIWNDAVALQVNQQALADVAGYTGVLPAHLSVFFRTVQPWTPLYMDWSVQWFPTSVTPGKELDTWSLGEIDYEWEGSSITPMQNLPLFKGRTLLNAQTAKVIQQKFESFVADDNYNTSKIPQYLLDDLKAVAGQISKLDILTQSMSGLMRQLTTMLINMNYAPADTEIKDLMGNSNTNFRPVVGADYTTSGAMFPIPAGHFQVQDLWIVDAFGQIMRGSIQSPILNIKWSESLTTSSDAYNGDTDSYGQLPPRLAQQASVNLDLLQADDDNIKSNSSDLTSPICGWVMPNHLDNSLMVFDASGNNQGAIIKVGRESVNVDDVKQYTIRWDAVPGSNTTLGAPPALENEHLQDFVNRLLSTSTAGSGAYDDLMSSIDASLWTMSNFGQQSGNLSLLLGRPLAVVRAEINLAFAGLPILNQSWVNTGDYYNNNGTYQLTDPPYTQTPFTIRVGDNQYHTNGVMGYFEADNYDTFYSVYGSNGQTAELQDFFAEVKTGAKTFKSIAANVGITAGFKTNYVQTGHLVSLTPDGTTVKLTLIVDPSGDIPVIPGSLPTGSTTLPNGPVSSALQNLKSTFRAGPLLLNPDRIRMPTPAEVKGNWFWMARKDVTTWNEEVPIEASTPVAGLEPYTPALIEGWIVLADANAPTN